MKHSNSLSLSLYFSSVPLPSFAGHFSKFCVRIFHFSFAYTIHAAARALMQALCGPGRKGIQVLTVANLFRPLWPTCKTHTKDNKDAGGQRWSDNCDGAAFNCLHGT